MNKKYVELLWYDKYDKHDLGQKRPLERPYLPFQTVETVNKPRVKGGYDISLFPEKEWPENYPKDWKNKLVWGDNKLILSSLIKQGWAGKLNLIYIDPPFFTGADFTIRTKLSGEDIEKEPSIIEERAYKDTWSGGIASYLKYMYERLVLMRELLAENGSIYIHCDWHVGHYLKVIMDEIFGYENFRNDLIWWYPGGLKAIPTFFPRKHDIILFYTKGNEYTFYPQRREPDESSLWYRWANYSKDEKTILYKDFPKSDKVKLENYTKRFIARHGRPPKPDDVIYEFEGPLVDSVWGDCPAVFRLLDEKLAFDTQKPESLLKRIVSASSNLGDIIADFFCGSGTTLAVAERLGRRWVGCDLSKFAIQVTRKRLLNIHNSRDLGEEKKEKYSKPARPFEIWNIGNYETVYWQQREREYLNFMLKLYQSQPLSGFRYLHGRKGGRIVHVGPLNAPVTMEEIEKVVVECRANNFNQADVLGWEWSYEVNELAKELAKKNGVDLKLIQIPSVNELKSALTGFDINLFKIPDQVVEKELLTNIKFVEVAYLEMEKEVNDKHVTLKITDFQISPTSELAEIASRVKDSRELVDYWAIDWGYKGDTFHNQWQSFRTKKEPKVDYIVSHKYEETGNYQIMVKVVDVFGVDTNKVLKVKIG